MQGVFIADLSERWSSLWLTWELRVGGSITKLLQTRSISEQLRYLSQSTDTLRQILLQYKWKLLFNWVKLQHSRDFVLKCDKCNRKWLRAVSLARSRSPDAQIDLRLSSWLAPAYPCFPIRVSLTSCLATSWQVSSNHYPCGCTAQPLKPDTPY